MATVIRGVPAFLSAQVECATCGRVIADPLMVETWGRYCSPRCYYGQGLPPLYRQGA